MNRIPELSIVLLNRNNPLDLVRSNVCAALRAAEQYNAEIVIVDDASDYDLMAELSDLPVKVFTNPNKLGIGESRSFAFQKVTSPYVYFIDADIEIIDFKFREIENAFTVNTSLAGVSGRYESQGKLNWNRALDLRRREFYGKLDTSFFDQSSVSKATFSGGFCCLRRERVASVRQETHLASGGEDILFQLSLLSLGAQFGYCPGFHGVHRHHRNSLGALRKVISDAHGAARIAAEGMRRGFKLPFIECFTSFPFTFLFLFAVPTPMTLLTLVELMPVFFVLGKYRNSTALLFASYECIALVSRLYYSIWYLCFSELSLRKRFLLLWFFVTSSIRCKAIWFARCLSMWRSKEIKNENLNPVPSRSYRVFG